MAVQLATAQYRVEQNHGLTTTLAHFKSLSTTGKASGFFLKGLGFFSPRLKKSIQRSHLAPTSFWGRQKLTNERKREIAMGAVGREK